MRIEERVKREQRIEELQSWRRVARAKGNDMPPLSDHECNQIRSAWSLFHPLRSYTKRR